MIRKLSLITLLPLALASPLALALGLGEVEVGSSLDAPLRASIPLTDTAGLEAGSLSATVADAEAYRETGLTRTPLAASVQPAIRRRQGNLVLDLATERAVRKPWLDLLLRFDGPDGRRFREVTLLLDPPDYAAMPVLVEGASGRPPAQTSRQPLDRPGLAAAARTSGAPARVRSGDTLWAVAERLRPDSGLGMNQMMLALVEANPEAFPSGNVNEMRAGYPLTVPAREAIVARSPERAAELVKAMHRAWVERGAGAPAPVSLEAAAPVVAEASVQASTVAGRAESTSAAGDEGAPGGVTPRLTLLTDEEAAVGLGADGDAGGEARAGEAARGGAEVEVPGTPAVHLDPEVLLAITGGGAPSEGARLRRLERRWQESRETLAAIQAERDAMEAELDGMRLALAELRERVATLRAGGAGDEGAGAGDEARQTTPWWEAFYRGAVERPLLLGGAAIALLLALWALVRRHDREEAPAYPFGEDRGTRPPGQGTLLGDAAAARSGGEAGPGASGRPTRAAMPEAEAISEADIFIAYGRYDQARELLEAGLAREPERDDLRLKLLRVQLERGERVAAERLAARLRASGDQAVRGEVERLLGRPPVGSVASAGQAVFGSADERPPSHVTGVGEEAPQAPRAGASPDDLAREAAGQDADRPPLEAEALPQVAPREGGSRVIDYRPPSLEPAAPGEETPRQPGVGAMPGEAADRSSGLAEGWAVEEVAFPPLGGDNTGSAAEASSAATLNEARHLLEVGEVREARFLLERCLEEADDTGAREEARDLLDRYQP